MEVEAVDEGTLGKIVVARRHRGREGQRRRSRVLLEEGENADALAGAAPPRPHRSRPQRPLPAAPAAAGSQRLPAPAGSGSCGLRQRRRSRNGHDERRARLRHPAREAHGAAGGHRSRRASRAAARTAASSRPTSSSAKPARSAPAPARRHRTAAGGARAASRSCAAPGDPRVVPHIDDAQGDRAAPARVQADGPAFLPDGRLRDRRAAGRRAPALNAAAPRRRALKLSVNDFVIKACGAGAARTSRAANASWTDDEHDPCTTRVDISVAVAIPGGLITPIVRNADKKGLAQISTEMKDLAARAKDGKLKPEEFQGGGFSISNLGMYGIKRLRRHHQPAAGLHPRGRRRRAAGGGEERPDRRSQHDELHAGGRSPRRRRRHGRAIPGQTLSRSSSKSRCDDAGC